MKYRVVLELEFESPDLHGANVLANQLVRQRQAYDPMGTWRQEPVASVTDGRVVSIAEKA